MTTTTHQRSRRTGRACSADESLIIPPDVSSVPAEVRELSDVCARRYRVYRDARAEYFVVRDRAKQAPAVDRANDAAASASGEPLATVRATETAVASLAVAKRELDAAAAGTYERSAGTRRRDLPPQARLAARTGGRGRAATRGGTQARGKAGRRVGRDRRGRHGHQRAAEVPGRRRAHDRELRCGSPEAAGTRAARKGAPAATAAGSGRREPARVLPSGS